jgi:hypothetical protein
MKTTDVPANLREFIKVLDTVEMYRDWYILEEIPKGWIIDKTAGAPAPKTVFITNGKSVLSGQQQRALLRVEAVRIPSVQETSIPKNTKRNVNMLFLMENIRSSRY